MIEIKVDSTKLQAAFSALSSKIRDTRPAMHSIAEMMLDSVKENFEVEGRPKWKRLKDETIKARKRKGTWPSKILTELSQLKNSISPRSTNTEAIVGTNVEYAATHQFGDASRNIPSRPFLMVQPQDIAEAERILLAHLLK